MYAAVWSEVITFRTFQIRCTESVLEHASLGTARKFFLDTNIVFKLVAIRTPQVAVDAVVFVQMSLSAFLIKVPYTVIGLPSIVRRAKRFVTNADSFPQAETGCFITNNTLFGTSYAHSVPTFVHKSLAAQGNVTDAMLAVVCCGLWAEAFRNVGFLDASTVVVQFVPVVTACVRCAPTIFQLLSATTQ